MLLCRHVWLMLLQCSFTVNFSHSPVFLGYFFSLCLSSVFSPGASKWDIREKVWDYIEDKNLANFPRPVHNRIPNFKAGFY